MLRKQMIIASLEINFYKISMMKFLFNSSFIVLFICLSSLSIVSTIFNLFLFYVNQYFDCNLFIVNINNVIFI